MADSRRDWIRAAVLLTVIAIVLVLLAPPASQVAMDSRLSTFRTTPDGAGALYETIGLFGVRVDRRITPLAGVDSVRGPLAILEPTEPLSPAELDSLFGWVERGGRLIVSPPTDRAFEERLGLALSYQRDAEPAVSGSHPWTEGIDRVGPAQWAFDPESRDGPALVPLVIDSGTEEPIVGILRRGRGEILAIADGQLLSNDRILAGGIAPLVVRAAAEWTPPGGALWFDEYHHGHRGGSPYRALARMLATEGVGRTALQLIVVALLALVPAAVRFGAPRAVGPRPRRSPLEHVDALGRIYEQAGAEELARRRLIAGFARRIGRDRPPPGEEALFLERLERNAVTGADAAASVATALARHASVRELAGRIDQAVQQLNRAP